MKEHSETRQAVKAHYEKYVYPCLSLLASIRKCDAYALNLDALWARFNGEWLISENKKIFLAGCGAFSPYPTAAANPKALITAMDLSRANLKRARLHTLLHLHFNVAFIEGNLLDAKVVLGQERFHFVDCYGVLHHIPEAAAALKIIHSFLQAGAIARIMVYSTQARRSVQAVRTALRMLRVDEVSAIQQLCKKSADNSRFRECLESNYEANFDWGLADMFLHPYARTYKINELLDILSEAHLEPILFVHPGALSDVEAEIDRLRNMESNNALSTNFVLFVGRSEDSEMRRTWDQKRQTEDTLIRLNPVIKTSMPLLPFVSLKPAPKLGFENPIIDFKASGLLSKFRKPIRKSTLEPGQWNALQPYLQALFLLETST